MPNLTENPHLQELLTARGIQIDPSIRLGVWVVTGETLQLGNVTPSGTIIGFCGPGDPNDKSNIRVIFYDESKEGQADALWVCPCQCY
ncbi:MAG: hypothetical protein AAB815_03410 [Patescibacteria group bacterium]